jgi:hypothetical protein
VDEKTDQSDQSSIIPSATPRRRLVGSLILLAISQALCLAGGYLFADVLGALVGLLLAGLLWVWVSHVLTDEKVTTQADTVVVLLLAMFSGFWAGKSLAEAEALRLGEVVRDISVAEAPKYHNAAAWVFTDAKPRVDLATIYTYTTRSNSARGGGTTTNTYHIIVAPLVPESWDPGQPVPAWVACKEEVGDCGSWTKPFRSGIKLFFDKERFEKARQKAESKQQITSQPNAPILQWAAADPDSEIAERRRLSFCAVATAYPPLVIAWAIIGFVKPRRSRRRSSHDRKH